MKEIFEKKIKSAYAGQSDWQFLKDIFQLQPREGILVLLKEDAFGAGLTLEYGEQLIEKQKFSKLYAVTDDESLVSRIENTPWISGNFLCETQRMEDLKTYYQLYEFSKQLIWGTVENIEDISGSDLEKSGLLTGKDIFLKAALDIL